MLMTLFSRALHSVLIVVLANMVFAPVIPANLPDKPAAQEAPKAKAPPKKQQPKKTTNQASKKTAKNASKKAPRKQAAPVVVTDFTKRDEWHNIETFISDMVVRHHFDKTALSALFEQVRYADKVIPLVRPAPSSKPKDWQSYRARVIDPVRIDNGITFWKEHASDLRRAQKQYGVPAEVIVAIIGVETRFGRYTGNFRVMDVLTTLAFDYPAAPNRTSRMAFFMRELEQTLLLARESNIDPLSLQGSFAGAVGLPQFMPGSIRAYGIDFDGDGVVDLRNSPVDAIGSVANFLKEHGWKEGQPTVFPATIPASDNDNAWKSLLGRGLKAISNVNALANVNITSPVKLPDDVRYGLIDLPNVDRPTEYWLVTDNFYAITQYNRSYFYAMSVVDFSHALRAQYDLTPPPSNP